MLRITSLGFERSVAILLFVFGVAELYQAHQLSLSEEFTLGPGAAPTIYAVGLLIFAGVLVVKAATKQPAADETPEAEAAQQRNYKAGAITFALMILYVTGVYFFGFLPATIVFSVLHLRFVMHLSILKSALSALIWGGGIYYLFDHLLSVQLEQGLVFGGG